MSAFEQVFGKFAVAELAGRHRRAGLRVGLDAGGLDRLRAFAVSALDVDRFRNSRFFRSGQAAEQFAPLSLMHPPCRSSTFTRFRMPESMISRMPSSPKSVYRRARCVSFVRCGARQIARARAGGCTAFVVVEVDRVRVEEIAVRLPSDLLAASLSSG